MNNNKEVNNKPYMIRVYNSDETKKEDTFYTTHIEATKALETLTHSLEAGEHLHLWQLTYINNKAHQPTSKHLAGRFKDYDGVIKQCN